MPRRRIEVARNDKINEILDAAEHALRTDGVAGLSIAALARQVGVAQNSIYWYFKGRDALLVGVLHRATKRALADLASMQARGPVEQLVSAVDRIAELGPLEAAMRQRAPQSPIVADFESTFDRSLRSLLRDVLASEVPKRHVDDIADAYQLAATGALARNLDEHDRQRLLRRTLEALIATADPPRHPEDRPASSQTPRRRSPQNDR